MKRFVVAIDGANKIQRDAIAKYVSEKQYGYWHWYQDFWLLTTHNANITSTQIRDDIQSIANGINCFVLAVESEASNWAGLGQDKHFEWLHKTWIEN